MGAQEGPLVDIPISSLAQLDSFQEKNGLCLKPTKVGWKRLGEVESPLFNKPITRQPQIRKNVQEKKWGLLILTDDDGVVKHRRKSIKSIGDEGIKISNPSVEAARQPCRQKWGSYCNTTSWKLEMSLTFVIWSLITRSKIKLNNLNLLNNKYWTWNSCKNNKLKSKFKTE